MNSLWANIFRPRAADGMQALLKQVPMFASLDRRELAEVEKILYRRHYRAEESIFRQGDPGVGMYVIERGTVVIVHEPSGRLLANLGDGDFFGEIALLNETPRSAHAIASSATTVYGLFQPELLDLVKRLPRIGVKLLLPLAQNLGSRLLHADRELQELNERIDSLLPGQDPDRGRDADPDADATMG